MVVRAVFPGTFDPLTIGHLAVADAAHRELGVDVVDLVISENPIDKSTSVPVDDRLASIRRHAVDRPWIAVRRTRSRLLADIAAGYDFLVIGADKWHQLRDVTYYDSETALRAALSRLPRLAVAPREGIALPDDPDVHVLSPPADVRRVSSTAVRQGRADWRA